LPSLFFGSKPVSKEYKAHPPFWHDTNNMLKGIEFSVWNTESILNASVCHVTEKQTTEKGVPIKNGLRDPRLGPLSGRCVTCNLPKGKCPGHFGHIVLTESVYHISWVTNVLHWLKCICVHCGTLLMRDAARKSPNVPLNRRMTHYVKHLHTKCPSCNGKQPKYTWTKETNCITKSSVVYQTCDVNEHLERLDATVLSTMCMSHPRDLLIDVLPVPPPNVRTPIMMGNVVRGEDDLTYRLQQILRANEKLAKLKNSTRPTHVVDSARESLQLAVTGYINHEKVGPARKKSSTREYTSLSARLKRKEGRIRGNLMGKRVDFTARTVITGDPHLGMNEVGVPTSVAQKMTVPVKVTDYNRQALQDLLTSEPSPVKFVTRPNGSRLDLSIVNRSTITLTAGHTVERSLQDGDIVLFNRQPSLHKMSLMAHEVRVLPYSTFRMNLSCTTPYNADCK
jgi:DNA-directed RNA polymerase beta' subunit